MRDVPLEEYEGSLRWLRESLELLAAQPSDQDGYLRTLPSYPLIDELALEYGDFSTQIDGIEEVNLISASAAEAMRHVNDMLESMSGPENMALWTPKALYSAPQWKTIRELAAHALSELTKADLSHN